MVVRPVRDVMRLRVRRHHHHRHADAQAVEAGRNARRREPRRRRIGHARCRRNHVVVVAAMLVVGHEERRARPVRTREEGIHDAGHESLSELYVRRWMLVALLAAEEGRVDERDCRQRAGLRVGVELIDQHELLRMGARSGEEAAERDVVVIDLPRHTGVFEQVEDTRAVFAPVRRGLVADAAERSARDQEEAIRVGRAEHRREVVIAHRERGVEAVVEGNVGAREVTHRAPSKRIHGGRVGLGEAAHPAVVVLLVRAVPGVGEISDLAEPRLVERRNQLAGIGGRVHVDAPESRRARLPFIAQLPEHVVEGAVLLHQHDDVVDRDLVSVRRAARQRVGGQRARHVGASATAPGFRVRSEEQQSGQGGERNTHQGTPREQISA